MATSTTRQRLSSDGGAVDLDWTIGIGHPPLLRSSPAQGRVWSPGLEHLQVVRTLECSRFGHAHLTHTATELRDRLILVLGQPGLQIVDDLVDPAQTVLEQL